MLVPALRGGVDRIGSISQILRMLYYADQWVADRVKRLLLTVACKALKKKNGQAIGSEVPPERLE